MTRIAPYLVLLVLGTRPVAGLAQPNGAQAEVLFRQGRDQMAAGKLAEACAAFEASEKLDPVPATLLNLAGCREKLLQLASAWGLFLEVERATRSALDAQSKQYHAIAQQRAAKLEPRVSKLTINVPQQRWVEGLQISRGGTAVDAALWNRGAPVDGGTYTISADAPGFNVWSTTVVVSDEGDSKAVDVPELQPLPNAQSLTNSIAPPAAPATPPPPATPAARPVQLVGSPSATHRSYLAPVLVTAGAVTLFAGALGFELSSSSIYDDAKAEQSNQSRRDSLYNDANTRRFVSAGMLAGGLLASCAAVWLFVRTPHAESSNATGTRGIRVSPSSLGAEVFGSF